MSNNIVNPEARDPLAQSNDRPRPSLAVRNSIPAGSLPTMPGVPVPEDPDEEIPIAPEQAVAAEVIAQNQPEQVPGDPSVAPDWILPSLDNPGPVAGVPRMRLRPINYENPVVNPIEFEDDATQLNTLRETAVNEAIQGDVIHSASIRERIARSNFTSRDSGYAMPRTYVELREEADAARRSGEAARALAAQPPALAPNQGMLGVGRNVLHGRPFSRTTERVISDHFSRIAEDGQYQTPLGAWIRSNIRNPWLRNAALGVSAVGRFDQYLQDISGDLRRAELELQQQDPNYRTLAQRVGSELRRFVTTPLPMYASGNDRATRFRSVTDRSPLLEMMAEESPAFRQLMSELGPTLDQAGAVQINPFRGEFGEFGSAGTFSAAMYLLNIPGGVLTGSVYEVAGSARNALARINPEWRRPEGSIRAVSPLLGIDAGFTNEYTENRYLSTIGNPALNWLPRRAQIGLGFALDVIADPDGLITRPVREAVEQAARLGARRAGNELAAALDTLVAETTMPDVRFAASLANAPTVVRSTDSGVQSAATTATLPTVTSLEGDVVDIEVTPPDFPVGRRPASQGGNIITVEDLVGRVGRVIDMIDNQANEIVGVDMSAVDIPPLMRETNDNYESVLMGRVREAHIMARGLQPDDFPAVARMMLRTFRDNGVEVTDVGQILLREFQPVMDALVAPVRMELASPLYRQYSDTVSMYRENPLALPPEGYTLVQRTDQEIVDLAKMWGVLSRDAQVSPMQVARLRVTNPEFGNRWGSPIDVNVSQPLRRIVEASPNSVFNTPEISRLVASPPPVTPPPAAAIPDNIEGRFAELHRKYADEVVRYEQLSSTSARNRAVTRMNDLRQQVAIMIADYPEQAAQYVARQLPEVRRTPALLEPATRVATSDMIMRQQHAVLDDLTRQLHIISRRLDEQQIELSSIRPLERRYIDTELDTRRLNGEEPIIRSVSTPTSMSNETKYPAAYEEILLNDSLLPVNAGTLDVGALISTGELSSLDPDEALDYVRNLVDTKMLRAEDYETGKNVVGNDVQPDSYIYYNDEPGDLIKIVTGDLRQALPYFDTEHNLVLEGLSNVTVPRDTVLRLYQAHADGKTLRFNPDAEAMLRADTPKSDNDPFAGSQADAAAAEWDNLDLDALIAKADELITVDDLPEGAVRRIGNGSFGTTFLMEDGSLLKRGQITTDEIRLQAKAAAQGVSPSILDEMKDKPNQFTMQFLDGYKPLDAVLYSLDPAQQSQVQQQLYNIVDRLHRAGIVHNDIYLRNIMVNPDTLDVKVIDFSIAKEHIPLNPSTPGYSYEEVAQRLDEPEALVNIPFGRVDLALTRRDDASIEIDFHVDGNIHAEEFNLVIPFRDLKEMKGYIEGLMFHMSNSVKKPLDFVASAYDRRSFSSIYSKYKVYYDAGLRRVQLSATELTDELLSPADYYLELASPTGIFMQVLSEESLTIEQLRRLSTTEQLRVLDTVNKETVINKLHIGLEQKYIRTDVPNAVGFGPMIDRRSNIAVNVLDDYKSIAGTFENEALYHGTHHTSWVDGDVYSLSNEFGPGLYLTRNIQSAITHAKAYPAQDIVTTSTRIPRREQHGNVVAVVIDTNNRGLVPNIDDRYVRDTIRITFLDVIQDYDKDMLARFKRFIGKEPAPKVDQYWHYLRSQFVEDENMTDLAKLQLKIRDNLVASGVWAVATVDTVMVFDQSAILYRSIPHFVDDTGTVASALAHRLRVDDELRMQIPNDTTKAIVAHNRLNMDTYLQQQAIQAVETQTQNVLKQLEEMHQQQLYYDVEFLSNRQSQTNETIARLERKTNSVINFEVRNINELCL